MGSSSNEGESKEKLNCPRSLDSGTPRIGVISQHLRLLKDAFNPFKMLHRYVSRNFSGLSITFAGFFEIKKLKDTLGSNGNNEKKPSADELLQREQERLAEIGRLEREIVEIRRKLSTSLRK